MFGVESQHAFWGKDQDEGRKLFSNERLLQALTPNNLLHSVTTEGNVQ